MEFHDIKKIWDTQNNQTFYGIDEDALHDRVRQKKQQARRVANATELFVIITYLASGVFIGIEFLQDGTFFLVILSGWMLVSGVYFLAGMIRRRINDNRFDRTMQRELAHAISVATYQVRLSQSVRLNTLPIVAIVLFGIWQEGRPLWFAVAVLLFFGFIIYASGLEHNIYKKRKRNLDGLQKMLEREV